MKQWKVSVSPIVFFVYFLAFYSALSSVARAVPYAMVALPDTQYYSEASRSAIFDAQVDWIIDNQASRNIIYVAHLGDIIQSPVSDAKWTVANDAMQKLETAGIPYGILPGNHDDDAGYNATFPPSRFSGMAHFGGTFDATNRNNYTLFSFGGTDFISFNLGFVLTPVLDVIDDDGDPANSVVEWVKATIGMNPGRKIIITSHYILDHLGEFGDYGQLLYLELANNPDLLLMLGGHDRDRDGAGQGEAWRIETTGRCAGCDPVHVLLANYQDYDYGGTALDRDSGYLRILTFDTTHDDIAVETFSPWIADNTSLVSPSPGGHCITGPTDINLAASVSTAPVTVSNFALTYGGTADIFPGVVLLLDDSGSMRSNAAGAFEPDPDLRRIKFTKDAANAFLDMLDQFNSNVADFAVAAFPDDPYSGCTAREVSAMGPINNGSKTSAQGAISGMDAPGPSTPLLAGIESASGMFDTQWCRSVVVLTDGYLNCPGTDSVGDTAVENLLEELNNKSNRAFTISFGRPGGTDIALLEHIADRTTPATYTSSQFFDATGPGFDPVTTPWVASEALKGTFKEIIRDILRLQTESDPIDIIEAGTTRDYDVSINEHDKKVSFYLSWRTHQEDRLSLTIYDSSDNPISINEPGVSLNTGATYRIVTVDQNLLGQEGRIKNKPWRMVVGTSNMESGEKEYLQYSVIMDSDLKMSSGLDRKVYYAGDTITLTAQLRELGQPVPGLNTVEVEIGAPDDGMGNWFNTHAVTEEQLMRVPLKRSGEVMLPIQRKSMFLNEIRGIDFPGLKKSRIVRLYDDGSHGDSKSNDGIYTNTFSSTGKEGIYSFYFRANGSTRGGNAFNREQMVQKYLAVRVVPEAVAIDVASLAIGDGKQFTVQVTPRDALGNYLGPGRSGLIQLTAKGGSFTGSLQDNLDGSYSQILAVSPGTDEKDVQVAVKVGEASKKFELSEELKTYAFSFHLGRTYPHGSFGNRYDPDLNLGLDLEYPLRAGLRARGDLQYSRFEAAQSGLSDTNWTSLTAGLKYNFLPASRAWQPYVSGGIGAYKPEGASTEPGVYAGIGVTRAIKPQLSVEIGTDYHHIFTSDPNTKYSTIRAGLIYHLSH